MDGVTVVKNLKKPMYGEDVLTLEGELTIGEAKEQTSYTFGRISGFAIRNMTKRFFLNIPYNRGENWIEELIA